jgi:pimeloyl-ACP methyl ester carboxylesterase
LKYLYISVLVIYLFNATGFSQIVQNQSIDVKPSSSNFTPVIFVPGIMGSPLYDDVNYNNMLVFEEKAWFGPKFIPNMWLANNGFDPAGNYNIKVAPLRNDPSNTLSDELNTIPMDLYKGFFDNLKANGYTLDNYDDNHNEGENLFCFAYDWRKNNTYTAQLLSNFIDSVIEWAGDSQVNLIGHSMGGIVSKTCINLFNKSRINKVVFIGTPHLGAPEMLTVMLKGKLFEWLNFVNEIEWVVVRSLARNLPSCYQLIPSSSYFNLCFNNGVSTDTEVYLDCFQQPNGNYTNYPELINYLGNYQSCLIENLNDTLLNDSEIFKETIDTVDFGNIEVFNIVGYNQWTIGKNRVIPGGPPFYCNTIEYSRNLNGDFTVPVRSAELINNQVFEHTYYIPDIIHSDLPASQPVLEILLGIFGNPPITNFPQFADPPPSYKNLITDMEDHPEIAVSFYLYQNFPNPFNPVTNIEFGIANPGFVTLNIYSIIGEEVATLINEELSAGSYRYKFDAGRLASGVYLYKLKAGDFVLVKKIILLK